MAPATGEHAVAASWAESAVWAGYILAEYRFAVTQYLTHGAPMSGQTSCKPPLCDVQMSAVESLNTTAAATRNRPASVE